MGWQEEALKRFDDLIKAGSQIQIQHGTVDYYAVFSGWTARAKVAIEALLGSDHTYLSEFSVRCDVNTGPHPGVEILSSLRSDLEHGYLRKTANLISAEVFADFLEMSQHLLEQGYKDPAASLCGAVFEDGLRRIAGNNNITVTAKDDLNSLRDKCLQKGLYNNLVRQQIVSWTSFRNSADHGKFDEYDAQQVRLMIEGVRSFLGNYLV
jgi:hypothetical protein